MVSWLSETNLISITNLGLNLNIASLDQILNKESSPLEFFSELSKLRDYSMETRLGCFYVTAILSSRWVEIQIEAEVDLRTSSAIVERDYGSHVTSTH